ncbi:dockerin type I domain-containing protein [Methanocalculus sp.]|uniref:dockerin type I domain-containing protein n=1 Tax=Methanocalculus sp. TaxID=2004547 RepID=UPI0017F3F269|nr:dockerin type I domain-containing protein [Methanocalculus sp.]HIJ07347.1 hypothetical protein [Methanocalculus sp.]
MNFEELVQQNADSKLAFNSVTVEGGQNAQILVSVANLTGATGIGFKVWFDPTVLGVEDVTATAQAPANTSVTWNVETYGSYEGFLHVAMTHDSLTVGTTPRAIAEITFNTTSVEEEVVQELSPFNAEWSATEFDSVPFRYSVPGSVTITPPELPDLTGYLDPAPPDYVKKYENGTVFLDPTFVIWNVGKLPVDKSFNVEITIAGYTATREIDDPEYRKQIDINGKYPINTKVTLDPTRTGEDEIQKQSDPLGRFVNYTILSNKSLWGEYDISIEINPEPRAFNEITFSNNTVTKKINVTYPDLQPVLYATLKGQPEQSDPKEINLMGQEQLEPGTYLVTYGVENKGNVYAVPTYFKATRDGAILDNGPVLVDTLQPGENKTWTKEITLSRTNPQTTFVVEVNANDPATGKPREAILGAPEDHKKSITLETEYKGYEPVTLDFPEIQGSTTQDGILPITLTNISTSVGSFSIPITFEPTVCTFNGFTTNYHGLVEVKGDGYGRLLVTGTDLNLNSATTVATINFKARDDSGRNTTLTSRESKTATWIKTTDDKFLLFDFTPGKFVQRIERDASVSLWAPTVGTEDQNVSVSVSVWNRKAAPVNVNANLTVGGTELWTNHDIQLGPYQSKYFSVQTWQPTSASPPPSPYTLNASISYDRGDGEIEYKSRTRQITINPYKLEINDNPNKRYWELYYGYDRSVIVDNYISLGTYYTTNQPGNVNATLSIFYPNGTPINLADNYPFEIYSWYPAKRSIYAYNSNWNSVIWYRVTPRELGLFNYTITLDARGNATHVNGTIQVREPPVDIKVLESSTFEVQDGSIEFDVFNRYPSDGRQVKLTASAGAEGRTLQGLEYLVGYPHGCPEQTMSPAFATLRVKQYYESRGKLTDELNASFKSSMQNAYNRMKAPDGYNAQKIWGTYTEEHDDYGAWAWGKTSRPSLFYTLYPNYVFSELKQDMQQSDFDWGITLNNTTEINLTASTLWLIDQQKPDGGWQDWGYISNRYEWTGFMSEKFCGEFEFIESDSAKEQVNTSLNRSFEFLYDHNYGNEPTKAIAYGIFGLDAIKEHYKENTTKGDLADARILELRDLLLNPAQRKTDPVSGGYYWQDGWYSDYSEATAHAVLALNKSGLQPDNETVYGGIRYLVSQYDTKGRWGNTRATAAVVNTLTTLQIPTEVDFSVNIGVDVKNGTLWDTVRDPVKYTFDSDKVTQLIPLLNATELDTLYGSSEGDRKARVTISGKDDWNKDNVSKLVVAVDSIQKIPTSVAYKQTATYNAIPDEFIDPIADDFELAVKAPVGLKAGDEGIVEFIVNNELPKSQNQTTMIIEIPIDASVNFTGADNADDKAYYVRDGSRVNLTHMVNRTNKKLFIYPGSDDASQWSINKGETKSFFVPMKFDQFGNQTVEARIYPMYNDQWMALGDDTVYVRGFGNLTLSAVNETNVPVTAEFTVAGETKTGTSATWPSLVEGEYAVSIKRADTNHWINTTMIVAPAEITEDAVQFVEDTSKPHVVKVTGGAGDVQLNPPEIEETISDSALTRWNAKTPARTIFNSSISSSGGTATIAVDVPNVTRAIGTVLCNDTIVVLWQNTTGWWILPKTNPNTGESNYEVIGDQLYIYNLDTSEVTGIKIDMKGRLLGDVYGDNRIRVRDAALIARSLRPGELPLTGKQQLYADVDNSGQVRLQDARKIARYLIPNQLNDEYNEL